DMVDRLDLFEDVGGHGLAGQGLECGRTDEAERMGRGHDLHAVVEFPESPDAVARFAGGAATGDAEYGARWSLKSIAPSFLTGIGCSGSVVAWMQSASVTSRATIFDSLTSRRAIDSGFSFVPGVTRGPTFSSSPSCSWA